MLTMTESKTVRLSGEIIDIVEREGKFGETIDDVIKRLLTEKTRK